MSIMAGLLVGITSLCILLLNTLYLRQSLSPSTYVYYTFTFSGILLLAKVAYQILLAPRFSKLRGIPTVPQGPLNRRLFKEPNGVDFLRWIEEVPNDGLLRFFGFLNGERLLLTTTEGTRVVHDGDTKDFYRPPAAKAILCRLTGGGIFAAEGVEHASQRREMQPAFKFGHLKGLYPTFWSKTEELVEALDSSCAGQSKLVDVDDWASRGTLDAISLAAFGRSFGSIEKPRSDLVTKYRAAFMPGKSAARIRILANILPTKVLFNLPMKRNRDAKACIKAVHTEIRRVVVGRMQEKASEKEGHSDILSVLLKSPKFTNIDDIVAQCMAFLAAGHEASALALGWTLLELSKDPERQKKLREEIRANLPSPGTDQTISASLVDKMPYLDAVVKESLRFWVSW
jgi:cytochrome P450